MEGGIKVGSSTASFERPSWEREFGRATEVLLPVRVYRVPLLSFRESW